MRSSSLPILASTTWESFEGLEISETKPPPGTDVKETMEKASLAITSTLLSDTTTLLPLTSSAPVMSSYETSLPVAPTLTSEAVIVQLRDTTSPSLASVISINAITSITVSDAPTSQPAPSETLGSLSHDDSGVQASEKFVPSLGSWAKPLYFKPPATPPEPSTPRDYDPAIVGNQLAALWPTLNDEILNKQPKVDIDILQQKDNVDSSSAAIHQKEIHPNAKLSLPTPDCSEPQKHITEIEGLVYELEITSALQPTLEQENSTASPNSVTTLPILVDSLSTPTATPIMESPPSIITNTKVCKTLVVDPLTTSSNPCAFENPSRFEVLGDVDEVVTEPSSSLSLTRGGRETKLPIKYQDMEWKTIRERGKRGRRGRGSYH
ncbi:unnamed protein product [Brassica oleracea]